MRLHEIVAGIAKDGAAPLYLVTGEKRGIRKDSFEVDDYLVDQAVAAIKAAVLGGGEGAESGTDAFNYDLLYGDETDASDILARAGESPVFAARRLILVKTADKLPAAEGEKLLPYLTEPCETTALVFVAGKKMDERRKFTQTLMKRAQLVDCAPPPESQLPAWIKAEAGRVGVKVEDEAVRLLADMAASLKDMAGGSLYLVRRELEKLAAYVPDGAVARAADVQTLKGVEPGASVFDLTGAIGAQDRPQALRILARNLEAGEDPLRILGALAWQYRRIWKAKEQPKQWGRESDLGRAFSDARLRAAFERFTETDSQLKGASGGSKARVLETLLLDLCARPKEAGRAGAR
ncbi:MAG: DNA polymerase III subunit delta [Nitrospirota bacterium]|nr:DNA polymerase III subunit delta [Nitrospirota bacterium]